MGIINGRIIHLLLVDDHAMFRQGLARVLEQESDFEIVGQFSSSSEALAALRSSGATMVLLDVNLGQERALDFVVESKRSGFRGTILIVTAGISGREAVQLMQAGVAGILHKRHPTDLLSNTIRRVADGEVYLEPEYFASLYRSVDRTKPHSRTRLTERDRVVLRFICEGLSNRDIGMRLSISEGGVKSSLRQLFDKLGVRTRAQLVRIALEQHRDQL